MIEAVATPFGAACADCPDLDNDAERPPPPWKPRARCCRDEHLDRRAAGDDRAWEGIERAREISATEAAAGITPGQAQESRQSRRRRQRKGKK